MLQKNNKIRLLWSKNFFKSFTKKRNIIGFDISALHKMFGRVVLMDGLCIARKGKNGGLISSSIVVRRKVYDHYVFFKFFIYFGSAFRYKVIGFSFKRKFIHYSKLSYARLYN
jgi:hypothetical protein